jgi:hypothetical protein
VIARRSERDPHVQGGFYPQVIERALDRIVYQTQQIAEKLGRAITLSASSALSGLFLPDPESGKYLRGRADGDGYENVELTSSGMIGLPLLVNQGGTGATTAATARTALGLQSGATTTVGTAATRDAGTAANQVLLIPGDGKLPTIDGSRVTGLPPTGMKNRIINGGMDIAQRGTSLASPANNAYLVDRFVLGGSGSATVTMSQQADAPSSNEFQNSLRIAVTSPDGAIATSDQTHIRQTIEGYNLRGLIGRDFVLSFWVRSSKTGTHCVSFRNSGLDRSYVVEYTVSAVDTWENKTVVLAAGLITAGTWNYTNGTGLYVGWSLACGSDFQTSAAAWQAGNFLATDNQVNCLDTAGNIFAITGVQLESGNLATAYEHRSFGVELALCQRYFEKSYQAETAVGTNTLAGRFCFTGRAADQLSVSSVQFRMDKRSLPTCLILNPATGVSGQANNTASGVALTMLVSTTGTSSFIGIPGQNTVTANIYQFQWTADAEL